MWVVNLQVVSSRKQHFKHERYRLTLQPVSRFVIFKSRANSETPLRVSLVHPIEKQSKRRPRTVIKHQTWVSHEMNFPSRLKTMNEKQIHTTAVLYGASILFWRRKRLFPDGEANEGTSVSCAAKQTMWTPQNCNFSSVFDHLVSFYDCESGVWLFLL